MCPLERAKTDSLWANTDRSSPVSRTAHGSGGKQRCRIIGPPTALRDRTALCSRRVRATPRPARRGRRPRRRRSRPPGGHAGEGVLKDRGLFGRHAERPGSDHHPVDAGLKEPLDAGGDQYVAGVGARRDHGMAQAHCACRLKVAHRADVGFNAPLANHPQDKLVLAVAQPRDGLGARRPAGLALGQLDALGGPERAHPVVARIAVDIPGIVATGSNGTNSSPVRAARSPRYPANISFHAAAWTVAVRVSTPPRSNRHARTPSGRPITAAPSARSRRLSPPGAPLLSAGTPSAPSTLVPVAIPGLVFVLPHRTPVYVFAHHGPPRPPSCERG